MERLNKRLIFSLSLPTYNNLKALSDSLNMSYALILRASLEHALETLSETEIKDLVLEQYRKEAEGITTQFSIITNKR